MSSLWNFSYYTKIQVSLWLFILLPLIAISLLSYGTIENIVVDKIKVSQQNLVNVVAGGLNKDIEDILFASNLIESGTDSMIAELRRFKNVKQITTFEEYDSQNKITEIIGLAFSKTTGINAVVFMLNDEGFMTAGPNLPIDLMKPLQTWISGYYNERTKQNWPRNIVYWTDSITLKTESGTMTETYRFAIKDIRDPNTRERLGTLFVGISNRHLQTLFTSAGAGQFELFDQKGNRMFVTGDEQLADEQAMVSEADIPRAKWKLKYTGSSEKISQELSTLFRIFGLLLGGCVLVFLILSVIFAKSLHRPLNKLRMTTEKFGSGNRLVRFPVKGNDEIAVLGVAFNKMLDQINQLITDVEHEQDEKRMIELQALFSQIQPHFLLNTLNSIKCNLLLTGDQTHGKQIDSLMSLLRGYMRVNELWELKDEMKLLQDYVDIMNMRNEMHVKLIIELPADMKDFLVPRLLLQPIVENAIIHGFIESGDQDCIWVSAYRNDNYFEISIKDNGAGVPEDKLQKLMNNLDNQEQEPAENRRIGLHNIQRRLKLTYGTEANLSFQRPSSRGVHIVLHIPAVLLEI